MGNRQSTKRKPQLADTITKIVHYEFQRDDNVKWMKRLIRHILIEERLILPRTSYCRIK